MTHATDDDLRLELRVHDARSSVVTTIRDTANEAGRLGGLRLPARPRGPDGDRLT